VQPDKTLICDTTNIPVASNAGFIIIPPPIPHIAPIMEAEKLIRYTKIK
jgi:hypothetical protein